MLKLSLSIFYINFILIGIFLVNDDSLVSDRYGLDHKYITCLTDKFKNDVRVFKKCTALD